MDLITINGYTPPSPTKYVVSYDDIDGADETLENGERYIEQVKAQTPSIELSWKNIEEEEASMILASVKPALFTCSYYFGELKSGIFKCSNPKITLKLVHGETRYYDVSLTLES